MAINEIMIWVWIGVLVLTVILEAVTEDLVSIWFTIGSVPALVLSFFERVHYGYQIGAFILVSLLMLFLTRPVIMKRMKRNEYLTNIDAIVGETGIITKSITPPLKGEVAVNNDTWTAVSDDEIEEGSYVRILAISGNKLIVEKNKDK